MTPVKIIAIILSLSSLGISAYSLITSYMANNVLDNEIDLYEKIIKERYEKIKRDREKENTNG